MDNTTVLVPNDGQVRLHVLEKLFAAGDFDGDGRQDTIFQHTYSKRSGREMLYAADPYQNDWDTVAKWFYDQDADVYLTTNSIREDTLHLGTAQGLYCLINVGDNNGDGKDELALVIDRLDYSRVNTCEVYSLCKGKWRLLKQFGVHEGSFDFTTAEAPIFNDIKDHLEKVNGKWLYKDYSQIGYDNEEEVGKMKTLDPGRCR